MRDSIQKILIWILSVSLMLPSFSIFVYANESSLQNKEREEIVAESTVSGNDIMEGDKLEETEISAYASEVENEIEEVSGEDDLFYLTYKTLEDGTISIIGCDTEVVSLDIPNEIDGRRVTSIGDDAFLCCYNLSDITLPEGLVSIGNYSFDRCTSLSSIILPEGLTRIGESAFSSCISLSSITLPKTLTSIGEYAFFRCSSLESITLPKEVMSIENCTFYECSNLNNIIFSDKLTHIGEEAFYKCSKLSSIILPSSLSDIGESAFYNCSNLNSVVLSEGITSIGKNAFTYCKSLNSIFLPESLNYIDASAFNTYGSNFIIYGIPNSYAHSYADKWNIKFLNINNDDENNILSYLTYRVLADGTISITDCEKDVASLIIPNEIYGKKVTSIGMQAFCDCNNLESIILPEGLISIEDWAFQDCNNLSSIIFSEGLTSIGDSAFSGCNNLSSVTLPESLTSIGSEAFYNCSGLSSITFSEGLTNIDDSAFSGCSSLSSVTLPESLISIGNEAFYNCSGLNSITFSEGLISIGSRAFYECIRLSNIIFPNSLTHIGYKAFSNCYSLNNISLPKSMTSIEDYAFLKCYNLSSIVLPDDLITVETGTFSGCKSLSDVILPEGLTSIDEGAFSGCTSLCNIILPESLIFIGRDAFNGCSNLKSVKIPKGVDKISPWTFYGCSSLSNITLPDGLVSIGDRAFTWCNSLNSIILPEGLISIEDWSFKGCGLSSITIPDSVTSIGDDVFDNYSDFIIYGKTNSYAQIYADIYEIIFVDPELFISYTIAFDKNNESAMGTMIDQIIHSNSGTKLNQNAYKCTGYSFIGWNTKADGSGIFITDQADGSELSMKKDDVIILYAQWKLDDYSIVYNLDGGVNSKDNPDTYNVITSDIVLKNPTCTGYTFGGWYSDSALTKKVTQIPKGSTGNKIFYAKWIANKYSIAFNGNGSTSGSMTSMSNCKYGSSYTLSSNTFKKTGYSFAGWNTKSDGSGTAYKDKVSVKNLTSSNGKTIFLYAQWKKATYSITYNLNGGKNSTGNPSSYNVTTATISLKNPTRTGYTFGGWYSDSKLTKKVTTIPKGSTGNKTVYAKWTANKYNIAFKGNGSNSGSMTTVSICKYGSSYTLKVNAFKRTGYTFTGWNTKADGTGTTYKDKASVKNLTSSNGKTVTLYAQWKLTNYFIKYNLNGGKNNSKNPSSYTIATADIKLQNPSRTGYAFGGWYSDSKLTKKVTTITKGSSGTKTLYAKWTATKYSIKYNLNGGKNNSKNPSSYTIATADIKLQNPTRTGYTFGGWYSDSKCTKKVTTIKKGSTGTKTLYAKWIATKYSIKYNLNGGKNNSKNPSSYTIATADIKLQNPSRTGYTFKGWYSDSKCTKKVTTIKKGSTGTKSFYAKWSKK